MSVRRANSATCLFFHYLLAQNYSREHAYVAHVNCTSGFNKANGETGIAFRMPFSGRPADAVYTSSSHGLLETVCIGTYSKMPMS